MRHELYVTVWDMPHPLTHTCCPSLFYIYIPLPSLLLPDGGWSDTHTHSLYFHFCHISILYRCLSLQALYWLTRDGLTHIHAHTSPAYTNIMWAVSYVKSTLLFVTRFSSIIHYTANASIWILTKETTPSLYVSPDRGQKRCQFPNRQLWIQLNSRSRLFKYAT